MEGYQHGRVSYARDTARAFPSVVHPSPQRAVPCSPWRRAAPAAPGAGWSAHAQRSASAGGRPPSTTIIATRSVHVSRQPVCTRCPSAPPRSAPPSVETQDPCCPGLTHIFPSPVRPCWLPRHPLPRSAAGPVSARHCCCPAVSASSAKTSSSTSLPTPTAGWRRFAVRLSTLGSQTSCEGCLRSTNTIWTVLYEESEVAKLRALYSTDPLFECSNVYITVESREKHLGNISTFSLTH